MGIRKVCQTIADLPRLDDAKRIILDIESTSFSDTEPGFQPFNGHRMAGVGVMTPEGDGWYVPMRHRPTGSISDGNNVPFEAAQQWIADIARVDRPVTGHNIKFDLRFMAVEGHRFKGRLRDTVVKSRLVDVFRFSAKLQDLCKEYLPEEHWKDDSELKRELKSRKTEDYGRVPADVCGRYCLQDLDSTMRIEEVLEEKLPTESKPLWEIEQGVTRTLLESEIRGAYVPRNVLKKYCLENAKRLVELQDIVDKLANKDLVDCLSNDELSGVMNNLCIKPISYTKGGVNKAKGPSWNAEDLRTFGLPICDAIAEYKERSYGLSNYGEGWLKRLADDDTLHPAFKQAGTKTGRLACEDPNFQNLDINGKQQVFPRPGHCFLSIDYSQIEFRLFAHYTNSPGILQKYRDNPMTDYHQGTADMLGIGRNPSKRLNFGMIYGMGREKLIRELTAMIHAALTTLKIVPSNEKEAKNLADAKKLLTALRNFNWGEEVTWSGASVTANCVYNAYHRMFPEIRSLARDVEQTVKFRKYVRNAFWRVYKCPAEFAHRARNYIIQGSAADLFKDRLSVIGDLLAKYEAYLIANVHDEVLIEVPIGALRDLTCELVPMLENPSIKFNVPIKVEVSVCYETWAKKEKYKWN